MSFIISVLVLPVYLLIIYPFVKKWIPQIIVRLGIGVLLIVASVFVIFILQAVAGSNPSHVCLFSNNSSAISEVPVPTMLIFNVLYGISAPLINITILEFISAQSPHTMKGLLLGVFYALRGLFVTLGSAATFPFAQEKLWGDQHGMFNCGFYYYLSSSVWGVFGLVVFVLAARWYRYRQRDDPPYRHQYVEDYYSRYTRRSSNRLISSCDVPGSYGTIAD